MGCVVEQRKKEKLGGSLPRENQNAPTAVTKLDQARVNTEARTVISTILHWLLLRVSLKPAPAPLAFKPMPPAGSCTFSANPIRRFW